MTPAARSRAHRGRGIRWLAIVLGAAIVAVVGWSAAAGRLPWQLTDAPPPPVPTAPARPADAFPLIVERVVDGDTLHATVDGPNETFDIHDSLRIRLIGIDTPEANPAECWSAEATVHLRALAPEGSVLWGAVDRDPFDRYDRALLYLWTAQDRFVNLELVTAGDAQTLTVEPNDAHADLFAAAEASAREQGAGRWGAC
ncbi:thermonuclease family protein [Microbacterium sp. BWT-B31]|uniref:thermonuclease family protein n=1 Tax=Microbacterium sp. BWT-B31 TaxID=3232072 RepID=UPI0035271079